MRLVISLLFLLTAFITNASEEVPEHVELEGKFKFSMMDSAGKMHFESYMKSPTELTSATSCMLQITADDNYYNTYPMALNLYTVDGEVIPFIQANAKYIDENSRYWNKVIQSASFSTTNLIANDKTWHQEIIEGNYMLFSPNLDIGLLAFHHITMGQPLRVELVKQGKPSQVSINVSPLSAKVASFVRKCLKLIDANS